MYESKMGMPLDLEHPRTFTEKIQWMKVYNSNFLKTYCTDKITLHEYCKKKLGKDLCIPLIKTYNSVSDINFNHLPNKCAIKCNHGCKMNIIATNLHAMNKNDITASLSKWMSTDFSTSYGYELHYKMIPHRILVEQYMNDGHDELVDYKFYCFSGKPLFCQVIQDRHTKMTCSHYTNNWTYEPEYDRFEYESNPNIPCPAKYNEMLELATKLSSDFAFVRVDFYNINGVIYLGELTFTPNSGYHHFKHRDADYHLGDMISLSSM